MKIFLCYALAEGPCGMCYAIAVLVRENGKMTASFQGKIPDSNVSDNRLQKYIRSDLEEMAITHHTGVELEEAFWEFWMAQKEGAICIAHCGSPEVSGLFTRCVARDLQARETCRRERWRDPRQPSTTSRD